MESVELPERACNLCDNPLCLGTFIHDWFESDSQLAALESESMFPDESFSEPPLDARDNNSDSSRNDDAQPPSPKRSQFQSATDKELSVAAAGIVP